MSTKNLKPLRGGYNARLRAVGTNLQRWREKNGVTQTELADAIEKSITHVSMMESSTRTPGIKTILELADVTGMSVDEMLTPPKEEQ